MSRKGAKGGHKLKLASDIMELEKTLGIFNGSFETYTRYYGKN